MRHSRIVMLLWLHVPVIFAYAVMQGVGITHALVEAGAVAFLGATAIYVRSSRRLSTIAAAVGLLTCSAVLVHLSGGLIEMHFHFFVMVGVVTLYQDWEPFLIAIGYVVFQHGVAGAISPGSVYNHQSAIDHPWQWAGVHGLFVLGMSAAGIASWRFNESLLSSTADREERLVEAQTVARLGSWDWDLVDDEVICSAEFFRLLDIDAGNGRSSPDAFLSHLHADDRPIAAQAISDLIERGMDSAHDLRLVRPDGTIRWVHVRGQVTEWTGDRPTLVAGTMQDITDRKRLESELAHQAFHDSLTGLANQALFRDRVGHALSRANRGAHRTAALFLDLDNFKTVNDSLGHTAGDEVLVAVAQRLLATLRLSDTAARMGGDEFAVLLEDLDVEHEALDVAERLLGALRAPFVAGTREVYVSASIGVVFDSSGVSADQLLRNADLAMYTAKREGKARYEVYEPAMYSAAVDRLEIENDLRRALDRHELTIDYQPIVSLASGQLSGMEALVRWHHPTRGVLPPAAFIPLAEETGLIRELGRQVLVDACTQVRRWQVAYPGTETLTLSVNLSPRQLHDGVIEHVVHALEVSGLPPTNLILEITESAMMHDADSIISKLVAIRSLGVRLAVDDFGTGYSSLGYLQRLPIDVLKIDRAFVAEGVESQEQADRLAALGCDEAQGFHLYRPLPVQALDALLRRQFPSSVPV